MKRSELPLLFPGIVLLLAAAAYALLFFTSRAEDVPSAVCTAALWQDTLSLKGVVSRGETPVSAPEGAVYPLVPDGERVAAGAPVALAGETGAELFRAALLLRVRAELASDTLPVPGGQALRSLSEALARRDFSALGAALPEARRSLGYAATGGNALRQEEEALLSSGAEETLVRAQRAGYFSTHGADGTMTVVSGSGWTFTAPLNEKTAARLPDGGSAVLLLPDETRVTAAVRITDAGEAVFSCGTHLESVLSLNECTLAVLLAEWEGYSVPESAILPGEDGETVCRVSGPVREYVPVTVLARRGGAALIASPMLRGGMSVLLFPAADSAPS